MFCSVYLDLSLLTERITSSCPAHRSQFIGYVLPLPHPTHSDLHSRPSEGIYDVPAKTLPVCGHLGVDADLFIYCSLPTRTRIPIRAEAIHLVLHSVLSY
jgi:hypothetical protein